MDGDVEGAVTSAVGKWLTGRVFDEHRGAFGNPVDDASVRTPFKGKRDRVSWSDAGVGSPFTSRDELVRVRFVQKLRASDLLKALLATVAGTPAEVLDEVDKFMLDNPLQCIESCCADQAADCNRAVLCAKALKEQPAGDGDLVSDAAGMCTIARG